MPYVARQQSTRHKIANRAIELAVPCKVDRATDPSTTPRHHPNMRRTWYCWDYDRAWAVFQASEAFGDKSWVCASNRTIRIPLIIYCSVCTAAGDRVPGPRSFALLAPVAFPWQDSVDAIEKIGSNDAFGLSLQLCREGLVCGPSSGFNLQGMSKTYMQKYTDFDRIVELSKEAEGCRYAV